MEEKKLDYDYVQWLNEEEYFEETPNDNILNQLPITRKVTYRAFVGEYGEGKFVGYVVRYIDADSVIRRELFRYM